MLGRPRRAAAHARESRRHQVSGRRIRWRELKHPARLLEDILQTPYEERFDPKFGGPLYLGLALNERLQLVPSRSPLWDVEIKLDANDLERPLEFDFEGIRRLGDLGPRFQTHDVAGIAVQRVERAGDLRLKLTLRLPERDRLERLARVFTKAVLETVVFDPKTSGNSKDWTPPDGTWQDAGRFFNETAEFFDPIQGAVANCYYIAALSAVAWASPKRIAHITRATGQAQDSFTNLIRFHKPDNGGLDKEIEVTDTVPLSAGGDFIFCRSSEAGEVWPAIYEKAYAKLKTGIGGDHPDITATGWGDCVWATAQRTGGQRHYCDTASRSGSQLWDLVRGNSMSYRTFNPMTAWTYSSGDATDKKGVYSDANIVASHCYTVLGWAWRDGRRYIVLRNPCGHTEATASVLADSLWMHDISWWRPIDLSAVDGTFAMEADAFKTCFAGLGVAK